MKLTLEITEEMAQALALVASFEGQEPSECALELAEEGLKALLAVRLQDQLEAMSGLPEARSAMAKIEQSLGWLEAVGYVALG